MIDDSPDSSSRAISNLLGIMRALRNPNGGCPWDREQDFASIAPYTIEEAYEVAGAIEEQNWPALKDELGDLMFQVVFHARMAEELGLFDFGDVVAAIIDKMERRHPHVFAGHSGVESAARQTEAWEKHKARERAARPGGVLSDVPPALPALLRALKLQKRAASVGFDWDSAAKVVEKIAEEAQEIVAARDAGANPEKLEDEVGDLLFAAANLARHLGVDPEAALRSTNAKFIRRFGAIETGLAKTGRTPADASLEEMEALWQAAKLSEQSA
ncbi:MAG TPA: nucleoside triphosphate pyrophosphohydrolase [Rhizomicrobium sp.]|jgi:ATP diphosphatase